MHFVLDSLYLIALALASPWLLWRSLRTGRYRRGTLAKLTGRVEVPHASGPVAWFHGVSVGEVLLLRGVVGAFLAHKPGWRAVVSATTDTGLAEARKHFEAVVEYPFDFSWACDAAIRTVQPSLIVLAESELWPNFLMAAKRARVPVAVVNARLSPRSFGRLRRVAAVARTFLLRPVAHFAAQSPETAERLIALGVDPAKVTVTGSVKYDGAAAERDTPAVRKLATLLGLASPDRPPVLVAGSTHAPEEALILDAVQVLRQTLPTLVTVLVPRHPDRFGEVAQLLSASGLAFVRRSQIIEPLTHPPAVVLLDSVGELGAAWALADVGFTGGSLDGVRGGQSMIEPAGLGVPTVFGPHVWNFRDAARFLAEAGAAVQLRSAAELTPTLLTLLTDAPWRAAMGAAAREVVAAHRGATGRTVAVLDGVAVKEPGA